MSIINFSNTRQMEGLFDAINPIKELIESKINLSRTADREKRINLNQNKVMRICFIVGLSLPTKRSIDDYKDIQLSVSSASKLVFPDPVAPAMIICELVMERLFMSKVASISSSP